MTKPANYAGFFVLTIWGESIRLLWTANKYNKTMEHSKQMIRIEIEHHDGTTRQYLPTTWEQILRLYSGIHVKSLTVYAITPRDFQEYKKKIHAHNLMFMRVVR